MNADACPNCARLEAVIAQLTRELAEVRRLVAAQQARIRELEARLGQHAGNSSIPPSANPPAAPPPVVKKPTGRKRGGQPGHPGHRRTLLPPEQVDTVVSHVPTHCTRCRTPLPAEPQPNDPPPTRHQVAEFPERPVHVAEHQGHTRRCPCCGYVNRASVPAAVRRRIFGPRLRGLLGYLTGHLRLSRRLAQRFLNQVLRFPGSLGTISSREADVTAALAPARDQALAEARAAPVHNLDETRWHKGAWLWVLTTPTAAAFQIRPGRGQEQRVALAGAHRAGTTVGSDRYGAYSDLPVADRQVCWSHLKRDFQKWLDRGDPSRLGTAGLTAVRQLFAAWHAFRGHGDRARLQAELAPAAATLAAALEQAQDDDDVQVVNFAANVLKLRPAWLTFATRPGVEPTNNSAERALRPAVIARKLSYGSQSERGREFREAMWTVCATVAQRGREAWDFLLSALTGGPAALPAPLA